MSENRPASIPFDSELAQRADSRGTRTDRVISTVVYHAGPEVGLTAFAGIPTAVVVHPVALPVVAALVAVWSVVDRMTRRRGVTPQKRSEAPSDAVPHADREAGAA